MQASTSELKKIIVSTIDLEINPEQIEDNEPLIGSGLELDSVDFLDILVALEKTYKIKLRDAKIDRSNFATVEKLVQFINLNLKTA